MSFRSPLRDPIDPHIVFSLIGNMKQRFEGRLGPASIDIDLARLYDEIAFGKQRALALKAERDEILFDARDANDQELARLDNARRFLKAEKLLNDGYSIDQVNMLLQTPDF